MWTHLNLWVINNKTSFNDRTASETPHFTENKLSISDSKPIILQRISVYQYEQMYMQKAAALNATCGCHTSRPHWKNVQPSERPAYLGILESQERAPLKTLNTVFQRILYWATMIPGDVSLQENCKYDRCLFSYLNGGHCTVNCLLFRVQRHDGKFQPNYLPENYSTIMTFFIMNITA